jgi:hypothetical protein
VKVMRLVAVAVAGVATLSLSGCSGTEGGRAAQVGDATVSTSDVDFLTQMQCDALDNAAKNPAQGQAQTVPTRQVRADMVNALVLSEVNAQLAAEGNASYDKATYRQVMDQFESAVQAAPAEDQDRFRDLVGGFYKGQLQVLALAQEQLASAGVTKPNDDEVAQAVASLQGDYRKGLDISVDPVYGPDAEGNAGVEDPSLSRAVSPFAKQAASAKPTPTWVADLPASQRCG